MLTLLDAQPGQTLASNARRGLLALQLKLNLNCLMQIFMKNVNLLAGTAIYFLYEV